MAIKAVSKRLEISAQRVRPWVQTLPGTNVQASLNSLRMVSGPAAKYVASVLRSAAANAENNLSMDINRLKVTRAFADEGPMVKRIRARARGRVSRINRRTCHITVEVEEGL